MSEENNNRPSGGRHAAGRPGASKATDARAASSGSPKAARKKASTAPKKRGADRPAKAHQGKKASRKRGVSSEARRIVTVSIIVAAVLAVLLGVASFFRPQINIARAHGFVASGEIDRAEDMLNYMIRMEYPEDDIANLRYDFGEYYFAQQDYAQVHSILTTLPEDPRTDDLNLRLQYREAEIVLGEGNIDEAAQRFYRLGDYADSATRYDDARTAIAIRTYMAGDVDASRHLFIDIDDPGAHVSTGARLIASGESEAQEIAAMEVFSSDNLNAMKASYSALYAARETTSGARIAAGYRHTVGLRDDGRVLAAGDNSKGQCEVESWKDIIQVAAGALHTVGLRLDGTVVAVGDNSFNQCKVSKWTDIKAVAATAFATLGLRSDGTIVATKVMEGKVSGWHGVTDISAGSYSVGCLYGQGSMICSHKAGQLNLSASLTTLSVCGAVSAGLQADGTMVSSYDRAPAWRDMQQVAVTQTGFLGVTKDGRALSFRFRDAEEVQVPIEGKALEIAGSGTHIVVLTEDGRVHAFGSSGAGQCDVSEWRLL